MARRKTETVAATGATSIFGDGLRAPVAPESFNRSQSNPNIDWEGMVASNPDQPRYTAQNSNSTLHESGNGWNRADWGWANRANGPRWSGGVDWNRNGRANRTGE